MELTLYRRLAQDRVLGLCSRADKSSWAKAQVAVWSLLCDSMQREERPTEEVTMSGEDRVAVLLSSTDCSAEDMLELKGL